VTEHNNKAIWKRSIH